MRYTCVMGTLAKHLLGLCFFFVLGLVIGAIPLGILCTPFIDSSHSKEAPVYGALIGGVCLVSAYVMIFLLGNSRGKNEPQANEVLVKQLLGLCFWAFAGFSGGAVLLAFLYTFVTDAYIEWQFEVGIVGGFVGAGCLSAGYIAYCRGVFSSSKKETARNYSMKQQN